MTRGVPLSEREREFIIANKDSMFPSQIATELSRQFPLDNKGYRSPRTIKEALKTIDF